MCILYIHIYVNMFACVKMLQPYITFTCIWRRYLFNTRAKGSQGGGSSPNNGSSHKQPTFCALCSSFEHLPLKYAYAYVQVCVCVYFNLFPYIVFSIAAANMLKQHFPVKILAGNNNNNYNKLIIITISTTWPAKCGRCLSLKDSARQLQHSQRLIALHWPPFFLMCLLLLFQSIIVLTAWTAAGAQARA